MENETIADIVREMRKGVIDWKGERVGVFDYFADRIEAASKSTVYTDNSETLHNALAENERLRAAMDEICKTKDEMIRQRSKQINRLNAAIAPVLAVKIDGMDSYCRVNCEELLKSIVREAQRIYKEGATND